MTIKTNPNGEEAIDFVARRDARRSEQQADRAFQLASVNGDGVTALKNAYEHLVQLFGALGADVANLRAAGDRSEMVRQLESNEWRSSLARLEMKLGTRQASSITDEAGAAYIRAGATEIEARARAAVVAAEIKKFEVEQRWASIKRVAVILSPLIVAMIAILVTQVNSCSLTP